MMMAVQAIVNPLRTITRNNAPYMHRGNGAQFIYDQFILASVQDLQTLMGQVNTIGGVMPGAQGTAAATGVADNKFLLESATHNIQLASMCTNPLRVTAYWVKPHKDLYVTNPTTGFVPSPLNCIEQGYGTAIGSVGDTTPTGSYDLNYSVYSALLPHYWKIYKRKTIVLMAGCKADFNVALGRSVVSNRTLNDPYVQTPVYTRRQTRALVFQIVSQSMGALTDSSPPSTGSLSMPTVGYAMTQKEHYEFRAMLDPRPVVSIAHDQLSANVIGTDAGCNFVDPMNAVVVPQNFIQATPLSSN